MSMGHAVCAVLKRGKDESFEKVENSLAHRKGVHDPRALAAWIGRRSMGKAAFQAKAAAARKG